MVIETGGLRERKKQATRRRIVETAYDLFERDGYEPTTVEAIAAAAEVSPATFYNYFPLKEDLLFPDRDQILDAGLKAIATAPAQEAPVQTLARAVRAMIDTTVGGLRDPATEREGRRIRLVMSVPQLQARMMHNAFGVVERLTEALRAIHPQDEADYTVALGAIFGAAFAAGTASARQGRSIDQALSRAVDRVAEAFGGTG
jgi:AcrR family transcriptional regulator